MKPIYQYLGVYSLGYVWVQFVRSWYVSEPLNLTVRFAVEAVADEEVDEPRGAAHDEGEVALLPLVRPGHLRCEKITSISDRKQ